MAGSASLMCRSGFRRSFSPPFRGGWFPFVAGAKRGGFWTGGLVGGTGDLILWTGVLWGLSGVCSWGLLVWGLLVGRAAVVDGTVLAGRAGSGMALGLAVVSPLLGGRWVVIPSPDRGLSL